MTVAIRLESGDAYPLGAHWNGRGINFAIAAPNATIVDLCLFDDSGSTQLASLPLPSNTSGVWHGYLDGAKPGLVYAYRVAGNYDLHKGHRFNPSKVLLDPYARAVVGDYKAQEEFRSDHPADTAGIALKGRVVHEEYEWGSDQHPRTPADQTVLYELHVKGFTRLHPDVPPNLRGTYAGLAQPAVLDYLQELGVTAVELLPIHHRADEARLQKMGLANYWGYSSIAFFAPERRYWSGRPGTTPVSEFRDMVKALHSRGLEVILDVVYNHTAETDECGPALSFRGIDNALYYHLCSSNRSFYENWSGCGNCLNISEPRVLQLVMDSLRYWVQEMHVDGFRFDLAPIMGRDANGYSERAAFFTALMQDPVLAQVKLIAEPWDIGQDGYRLGHFPVGWMEWNDQYRDTMRSFWLRQWPTLGAFAQRFAASSDLFRQRGRLPHASINFITAHDGYTLQDLVSYNHKHNDANGENNRDGHHHNHSWNCGVEGPTNQHEVVQLRLRLKRALLATLVFSQGTPMLLAGDEIGHTQRGNNNAYCQDNEIGWLNWNNADREFSAYVARLLKLRRQYPALRYDRWFSDSEQHNDSVVVSWKMPDGQAMQTSEWDGKDCYRIAILLEDRENAQTCLLMINAEAQSVRFRLPQGNWRMLLDSSDPHAKGHPLDDEVEVPSYSLMLAIQEEIDARIHPANLALKKH
jgi:glycogen operon protein